MIWAEPLEELIGDGLYLALTQHSVQCWVVVLYDFYNVQSVLPCFFLLLWCSVVCWFTVLAN